MNYTGRKACTQFCAATKINGENWIKASFDLDPALTPRTWERRKKDGSPVNYVFRGEIDNGAIKNLTLMTYGGRDDDGVTIWKPRRDRRQIKPGADGFETLHRLAELGATIYFYPNQPHGGISNKHVLSSNLLFYEIDDLPLAQQWEKLDALTANTGLQPAAVVFTGGKSLHCYFRLTQNVEPDHWKRLNQKLTVIQNGDPAICNPARAMRLPGMVRRKAIDGKLTPPTDVSLEFTSDACYTPEEFEQALDSTGLFPWGLSNSRWLKWRREGQQILTIPEEELFPKREYRPAPRSIDSSIEFPLEICLTKDDRELIESGAGKGERNNLGLKLAKNLIATASYLSTNGYRFRGDERNLFESMCDRCSPPIDNREREAIWQSAGRGNPTPSLPPDGIEKAIAWWQYQNSPAADWTEYDEPDPELYAQYEQQLIEEAEADAYFETQDILSWLKRKLRGFGALKKKKTKRSIKPRQRQHNTFTLDNIPEPGTPSAKITYKKGERAGAIAAAIKKGWGGIVDISPPGRGKSHTAGLFQSTEGKVWYCDRNHRNPSTLPIEENFEDLHPRHNGLEIIPDKFTASGANHLRRWSKTKIDDRQSPLIQSNCYNAEIFNTLKSRGYNPEIKTEASASGNARNPICAACPHGWHCHSKIGDGYGFIAQRLTTMKANNIRAHLDSLPDPTDYDYKDDIIFVEEAGESVRGTDTRLGMWNDIARQFDIIEREYPEIYQQLQPIKFFLQDILEGRIKGSRFGFNHERLMELLGTPPENIQEIVEKINNLIPDISELIEEPDFIAYKDIEYKDRQKWNNARKFANDQFKQETRRRNQENLESLPVNLLPDFLSIWAGLKRGAIRIEHNLIKLTVPDERHARILQAAKAAIFLDATADKEILARQSGISPNQIIEIEEEVVSANNHTVVVINIDGMGSRDHSPSCIKRQKAVLAVLNKEHSDLKAIAHKGSELAIDGYWFRDNRGTNEFKGKQAIACFGTPYPNLGIVEDEYRALFGSLDGFNEYYQHRVSSEIIQFSGFGGRQRSHLEPDKPFITYLIGTDLNLDFLKQYGCRVEYKSAWEICPEAGSEREYTNYLIAQAIHTLKQNGDKIDSATIAKQAGVTSGRIRQIFIECFGGTQRGIAALVGLIKPVLGVLTPKRLAKVVQNIPDGLSQAVQKFLPSLFTNLENNQIDLAEAIREIAKLGKLHGWRFFRNSLALLEPEVKAKLVALVYQVIGEPSEEIFVPPPT